MTFMQLCCEPRDAKAHPFRNVERPVRRTHLFPFPELLRVLLRQTKSSVPCRWPGLHRAMDTYLQNDREYLLVQRVIPVKQLARLV